MKYHVRNADGELVVPSYKELRTLYKASFITDEDEVRKDDSERWVKAGTMTDLKVLKPRAWWDGFEFAWLAVAISVITLVAVLLTRHHP